MHGLAKAEMQVRFLLSALNILPHSVKVNTLDFDSSSLGSNPSTASKRKRPKEWYVVLKIMRV